MELTQALSIEEQLVAELERLGIRYLSRLMPESAKQVRNPGVLLADLILQPSSRVRTAVIALLLAHPEYASSIPIALARLQEMDQLALKLFYTAAVWLQRQHAARLQVYLRERWQWLPDLFSTGLGLSIEQSTQENLRQLGEIHRQLSGIAANWVGTYQNVALQLLRRWDLEKQWNQ